MLTAVILSIALEIGKTQPSLRVVPEPDRRALVVASHAELAFNDEVAQ